MKNFINTMDNLPWIIKIILSLPGLDLIWAIYRIVKGVEEKNTVKLIVGILWIVIGTTIFWVTDLVCSIFLKKPVLFA